MRKPLQVLAMVAAAGFMSTPALASPISLDFSFTSGSNTYDFGTMTLSVAASNSLQVRFDALNPAGVTAFQVTGFGFDFNPERSNLTVTNPTNGAFDFDQDGLNWIKLENLNPIPNPTNTDEVSKRDFEFGVTEGNSNNFNVPGIGANQSDIFFLNGFSGLLPSTDVGSLLDWAGIRIQGLSGIGENSLFLVGTPRTTSVPEPMTLSLLGVGLAGLALARRRKAA